MSLSNCVFFNDTTSQLNWGCHSTSYFTKKFLKSKGFDIKVNITLHESLDKKKLMSYIEQIKNDDIKHVFVNGEGSLYEQACIKGKSMIIFINEMLKSNKIVYLINSGFDLFESESIKSLKYAVNHPNLIVQLREPVSIENFNKYYDKTPIFQPDYLYTITEEYNNVQLLEHYGLTDKDYIAVGGNSNYYRSDRKAYDAISVYIEMINKIKTSTDKEIILYASSNEEIVWLQKIADAINVKFISVDKTSWQEAYVILSHAHLSISGRYHPTIMSLLGYTPCLMISANQCKMNGINEMFFDDQFVIDSHKIHDNYDYIIRFIKKYDEENVYKQTVADIKCKIYNYINIIDSINFSK